MADIENLGDLFRSHVGRDKVATIDLHDPANPREVSYDAFDRRCDAFARGLSNLGLGVGDRIAVMALNRTEYLEVLFGALRAGCVPVPINVKQAAETVGHIIRDSGTRHVFAEADWMGLVPEGVPTTDLDGTGSDGYEAFLDYGPFQSVAVEADTVSMQIYTSGTTGQPKGVLLTHRGQGWASRVITAARRLKDDDRVLMSAPFFHKNALVAIKTCLCPGSTFVILPRFDAKAVIRAIDDYKCTMTTGVPTMLYMILAEKELLSESDVSSVRIVSMGSAPASDSLLAGIREAFPTAAIRYNYGTTEGGPITFGWFHPKGLERPPASIGYPMEGCEFKLIDGPSANEGELVSRNPGVALGYHNNPEATAKQFRDGWYHTGDVLRLDEDGWAYFVGRVDDMFVCGGENIYPAEVETLLCRHPGIRQAAVLPFAHEIKNEVPYAFVVAEPVAGRGTELDEDAVKQHAIRNGPAYAHPRRVFFLDELPLMGTNKVDTVALRALAEAEAEQPN